MMQALAAAAGGGGLSASASSSAGGDDSFDNAFNYKSGGSGSNDNALIVLGVVAVTLVFWGRK